MQQSIHLGISDMLVPREAVGLPRLHTAEEPSVRFDDILNRHLSAERENRPGNPPERPETRYEEPAARQDDRMRVDREGPAGREERDGHDMRVDARRASENDRPSDMKDKESDARRASENDRPSDMKDKESDARRASVDAGRKEVGADFTGRKKADDVGDKEALLPGTRKSSETLRENQAMRKKTGMRDDEGWSQLLQRLEVVQSRAAIYAEGSRELRDVKAALAETRDVLQSRGGRTDRALLDALGERLRELAKRIEAGQMGGREARQAPLGDEIQRIADMVTRLARRTDRAVAQGLREEPDQQQPRSALLERTIVSHGLNGRDQVENSSPKDGNSSAFGFQFAKNAQGADKNAHAAPLPRQNPLFEEQLQSLVRNARVVVQDAKNGSFQMRLYPESLGRVNVSLGLEQGTITGRFLVETVEARQALVGQLEDIRQRLAESGISVGEFQVNVRGDERYARQSSRDYLPPPLSGTPVEANGRYELQSVRHHDGFIDVTI
ncbi:MAG TPA: flagellar hook-length control protein FliK [Spirochaetota bacterium]|nr:flagellar hook-length control protein FliK [Spirochaetota bacterium]